MNYIEEFLIYLKVERNYSGNTISAYKADLEIFSSQQKDIINATQEDITKFRATLDRFSPSTQNRIIFSSLASFYSYLLLNGRIGYNPIHGLKRCKVQKKEIQILTEEQIKEILKEIVGEDDIIKDRNRLVVMCLVDTGARISEIVNIKIKDIKENQILINGKGNSQRTVFISNKTKQFLVQVIETFKRYGDFEYLFTDKKGRLVTRNNAWKIINETSKGINLPNIHPHCFRHTFCSNYLRNGGTEDGVRKICGWSSFKMLKIYREITNQDLEQEYNRVMRNRK